MILLHFISTHSTYSVFKVMKVIKRFLIYNVAQCCTMLDNVAQGNVKDSLTGLISKAVSLVGNRHLVTLKHTKGSICRSQERLVA